MGDERYFTVQDIVDRLGVHERTVRRWIRSGELPAAMLGRKAGYRVSASDFAAFMEARKDIAVRAATDGRMRDEGKG